MSIDKLGSCQVCCQNKGKYRCPRCETVSCSLECSKAHKRLNDYCDGIRDKTKFVPLDKFTSMELVSDLSLLENAARYSTENQSASPIKLHTERERKNAPQIKAFQALQRACWRRNKCKLLALPSHFTRHVKNSSKIDCKQDLIFWKITWILPHHVKKIIQWPHISERSRLSDLIKDILNKLDIVDPEEISVYKSTEFKDLKVLLKCEFMKDQDVNSRFIEMDTEKSLVWNLQEKTLVENPIIVIVHKNHSSFYLEDNGDSIKELLDNETNTPKNEEDHSFVGLNFSSSGIGEDQPEEQHMEVQEELGKKSTALALGLVAYPSSEDET